MEIYPSVFSFLLHFHSCFIIFFLSFLHVFSPSVVVSCFRCVIPTWIRVPVVFFPFSTVLGGGNSPEQQWILDGNSTKIATGAHLYQWGQFPSNIMSHRFVSLLFGSFAIPMSVSDISSAEQLRRLTYWF